MLQGGVLKFHFPPFQGSSVSRAYLKKVKKKKIWPIPYRHDS